jgi:hypothetical protein
VKLSTCIENRGYECEGIHLHAYYMASWWDDFTCAHIYDVWLSLFSVITPCHCSILGFCNYFCTATSYHCERYLIILVTNVNLIKFICYFIYYSRILNIVL